MLTSFPLSYIEQVKHEAHVQKRKYLYLYYNVSMYLKKNSYIFGIPVIVVNISFKFYFDASLYTLLLCR